MSDIRDQLVKVASPQVGQEEADAVREVLLSGRYVSGPKVAEFERLFADYVGVNHAVAVNSGTAALQAALMAIGVGAGDEIVVPALTFFSTATSVMHQNAVPIFADISLDSYCMDPEDLERHITPRTKAVIPVHYFGHAGEMDQIKEIAARHNTKVIEDCAQSHGTLYKGQQTGSMGDLGAFSFFATKHMTTGEGGIVTTDNPEWAELIKQFRSHGMKGRNDHILLGYNYRMTEMAAAMGIVQLGRLDALNEARIRVSETLMERLRDIRWMTLPRTPDYVRHAYFWLHAWIDEEQLGFSTQELIVKLREKNIEVRHRYVEPLYRQPLLQLGNPHCPFHGLQYRGVDIPAYGEMYLPNAEKVAGHIIGLPNRSDMTEDEIEWVSKVVHTIQSG